MRRGAAVAVGTFALVGLHLRRLRKTPTNNNTNVNVNANANTNVVDVVGNRINVKGGPPRVILVISPPRPFPVAGQGQTQS